jgi:hypothetical protein
MFIMALLFLFVAILGMATGALITLIYLAPVDESYDDNPNLTEGLIMQDELYQGYVPYCFRKPYTPCSKE